MALTRCSSRVFKRFIVRLGETGSQKAIGAIDLSGRRFISTSPKGMRLGLLFSLIGTVFATLCSTQWNCSGCTKLEVFGIPCRWCPEDGKCHNPGDFLFSKCNTEQQITNSALCSPNEPTMKPCPLVWSQQLPAGWQAYPGDSFFFHCGFRGMIEASRAGMVNECFYDETG